ncbi:similar to Meyerozyma guilliermondii PGUG_01654 hypothetical protein [Maudiozyma saulgeensis]|uniref:YCII-related domain-containing protein n=1 Tax=Maudiozyma saulgeensis TaxID=1789683 RepID=A0A1X7R1K5_9SACH|nr:similar to Meyerozyma guilliermondii PGUG_01654 hypothetical protein [Kazachstania saulgeensis]
MGELSDWSVIVYDKPGVDRTEAYDKHVKALPAIIDLGLVVFGGQINDDSNPRKPIGSSLTIRAETKEDAIKLLKQDVFYKEGIWDVDNAIIHHFNCVFIEGQPLRG